MNIGPVLPSNVHTVCVSLEYRATNSLVAASTTNALATKSFLLTNGKKQLGLISTIVATRLSISQN